MYPARGSFRSVSRSASALFVVSVETRRSRSASVDHRLTTISTVHGPVGPGWPRLTAVATYRSGLVSICADGTVDRARSRTEAKHVRSRRVAFRNMDAPFMVSVHRTTPGARMEARTGSDRSLWSAVRVERHAIARVNSCAPRHAARARSWSSYK